MKYPSMSLTIPTDPRHPGALYVPGTPPEDPRIRHPTVAHMREAIVEARARHLAEMAGKGPGKHQAPRDPRRGKLSGEVGWAAVGELECGEVSGLAGMEGVGEGGW